MEKTLDVPELITIHPHLQRCWIRTPDSITSDRIWSRYQNERLLNQRNSPPGKYDPRSHLQRTLADTTIRRRQIDDKNWLRELLQADYNAAASWLQRQCKPITTPEQADYRDDYKLITSRCMLITRTIASWLQAVESWLRKHYIIVRCEVRLDCKPCWA